MNEISFFFGIIGVEVCVYFSAFVIIKVLSILDFFFEDDDDLQYSNIIFDTQGTMFKISELLKAVESLNNNPEAQNEYIEQCLEIRKSYNSSIDLEKYKMTEKEKAYQIVNKFYQPLGRLNCNASSNKMWQYAKTSSIFMADEMLKTVDNTEIFTYWFNVKKEIIELNN